MELPKNVTQVGSLNKTLKVYIEDYVISYLKQLNSVADNKRLGVALYGRKSAEDVSYYFVYGACKLDYLNREGKRLSVVQVQEIENHRVNHFKDLESIGYVILTGESIDGIYVLERENSRYVAGYSCFYEKNDSMLSFMLENRGTRFQPEMIAQEKYVEVKSRQEDRRRLYEEGTGGKSSFPVLQTICAVMFMVLCVSAFFYTRQERGKTSFPEGLSDYMVGIFGGEENTPAPTGKEVISTLVAQNELTQEIQKENEEGKVQEASGQSVGTPLPTVEPALTPEPTQVPTPEPTAAPTPEPTVTPVPVVEYVICPGDTLISICTDHYGDESYVQEVCATNGIVNPDNICVGQKIVLP